MSEGAGHDVGVMIKSISTLVWQNDSIRNQQLKRVSLTKTLKRHFLSQRSSFEDDRILTGIDFRLDMRRRAKSPHAPISKFKFNKSKSPHEMDSEPFWVSLLGGVSLFLGLVTVWILA
jgi:phosphate/sulfate permease